MDTKDLLHWLRNPNGRSIEMMRKIQSFSADLIEQQAAELERLRTQVDYMEQVAAGLREEMQKAESDARRLRRE